MKAVVIYDDVALLAKANATLRRVGFQPGVDALWSLKSVPIGALNDPSKAEEGLMEASDAQLIIIPARHARVIPLRLLEWLEGWAALRRLEPAAIGILGDPDFNSAGSSGLELKLLIQKHGLDLIANETSEGKGAKKLFVSHSLENQQPLSIRLVNRSHAHTQRSVKLNERKLKYEHNINIDREQHESARESDIHRESPHDWRTGGRVFPQF